MPAAIGGKASGQLDPALGDQRAQRRERRLVAGREAVARMRAPCG